ncbi:MAG TPA: hypothetical protein VFS05_02920 [Gemmatimonadaceae bacterium]|nr:hypothetical protein [Gemmatimonadaceae bacterium]
MDRKHEHDREHEHEPLAPEETPTPRPDADEEGNPPRTTRHGITAPKFGAAGSGGLEYEGPLKKD